MALRPLGTAGRPPEAALGHRGGASGLAVPGEPVKPGAASEPGAAGEPGEAVTPVTPVTPGAAGEPGEAAMALTTHQDELLRVAVDTPLATLFDYLPPDSGPLPAPGSRVRVPFARHETVGVVFALAKHSTVGAGRLRRVLECLDPQPLLGMPDLELISRVSAYYHHPIGEVMATALPVLLRKGRGGVPRERPHWRLSESGRVARPARAIRLAAVLDALRAAGGCLSEDALRAAHPGLPHTLRLLAGRGWIEAAGAGTVDLPPGSGPAEPSGAGMSTDPPPPPLEGRMQSGALAGAGMGSDGGGERSPGAWLAGCVTGPTGGDAGTSTDRQSPSQPLIQPPTDHAFLPGPILSSDQRRVVDAVLAMGAGHAVHLLEGVTGSGKTEVYLHLIEAQLAAGRQSLLLVPEIALSDQTLHTLAARIRAPVALLHSGLSDTARARAWRAAATGLVRVVLGTRSAVWTPLPELGLVVVDEEHDTSYKQGEGLRYSARDVAVLRARIAGVPVLLGSATPALESWANARQGRYRHHRLPTRVGPHAQPAVELVDIRGQLLDGGLGPRLLAAIRSTLAEGGQCLLFLNRRGYAPVLMCHTCGWTAICPRCDTRMTWHRAAERLRCHHCLGQQRLPRACPQCAGDEPAAVGHGTERLMEVLAHRFPAVPALRVDTDSTRPAGSLARSLAAIRTGAARILVGTQMLAKGHHFPELSLVGVVDADDRLYSSDFRARERLTQLLLQVSGRCGRGDRAGRVLIQTHHPAHPLLAQVVHGEYAAFADAELAERARLGLPPRAHAALLRAESTDASAPLGFLEAARSLEIQAAGLAVRLLGPIPSAMARRAGRHRAQLWIEADTRGILHAWLRDWVPGLGQLALARKVRWSLDVDPQEVL